MTKMNSSSVAHTSRTAAIRSLQDAFGPDYFRTVYAFDMPLKTKGADLDFMRSLTELRIFALFDSDVRDEHLTHIHIEWSAHNGDHDSFWTGLVNELESDVIDLGF